MCYNLIVSYWWKLNKVLKMFINVEEEIKLIEYLEWEEIFLGYMSI